MIVISNLTVQFHQSQRYAVENLSVSIGKGEILGLVGESGSGKSVTAMSIAGLLPRRRCTATGSITLDGQEIFQTPRDQLRATLGKDLGVVFQSPTSAVNPLLKVGKQVEEVLKIHTNLTPAQRKQRAIAALTAVDLHDPEAVYNAYPHQLSGGMLQRAMIAAAIVSNPKLLLLDEPTTALDVTIQAQILQLLKRLNEERGISMLFISHNLAVVSKLCHRTAVMQRGHIVEQGDTHQVFHSPQHPYTKTLIDAIPRRRQEGQP